MLSVLKHNNSLALQILEEYLEVPKKVSFFISKFNFCRNKWNLMF